MASAHYSIDVVHLGTWARSWGYVVALRFSTDPDNVVRISFHRCAE